MEHRQANGHDGEKPTSTSEYSDSRSSIDSDSSPRTPPTPVEVPIPNQLPVLEPHITMTPSSSPRSTNNNNNNSNSNSNRSPKRLTTPVKARLGAIDEDTDKVSPDVPVRDPRRLLNKPSRLFSLAFPPTLHSTKGPPNRLWDDIIGPNGEKFRDVRNNKNVDTGRRRRRQCFCIGLILLVIAVIVVAIVPAVVLTRKHRSGNDSNSSNNGGSNNNNPSDPQSSIFPAGSYKMAAYLNTTTTDCTSDPTTWICYPKQTYAQSINGSYVDPSWTVTRESSKSDWTISSDNTLSSYQFTSIPLTLENKGDANNEAYVFTYTYNKPVLPLLNGAVAICYFNNTVLSGRLYTSRPKQADLSSPVGNGSTIQPQWPYALEFTETIGAGANTPNCYQYINGGRGDRIDVASLSNGGQCTCGYTNTGL